jgi:hypothetical protein
MTFRPELRCLVIAAGDHRITMRICMIIHYRTFAIARLGDGGTTLAIKLPIPEAFQGRFPYDMSTVVDMHGGRDEGT